jgi:hypothetical protein
MVRMRQCPWPGRCAVEENTRAEKEKKKKKKKLYPLTRGVLYGRKFSLAGSDFVECNLTSKSILHDPLNPLYRMQFYSI